MKNIKQKLTAIGLSSTLVLSGVFISKYEGKENKPYLDPVNILTVCYGSTKNVIKNKLYTDDECLKILSEDIQENNKQLLKLVKVPLNQNQHAAFLSFIYNIGYIKFKTSTLLRKLNNKEYTEACNQLLRWDKAGGKVLKGLTLRRQEENKLCLTPVTDI